MGTNIGFKKNNGEEYVNSGFCGVGLIQIYVKTDGGIYGCAANLESSGCLGDVGKGFSVRKNKRISGISKPK